MQNTSKQMTISPPTVAPQTRPATDFSIHAIIGRNTDSLVQMTTTAVLTGLTNPKGNVSSIIFYIFKNINW